MRILIAGDFCPRYRVLDAFNNDNYSSVLGEVKKIVDDSDYSIVNFECPVVTGDFTPIEKQGPNLSCSPKGVDAIKYAGFKCATLANNHFRDFGDKGCLSTIEELREKQIDYVGGGRDSVEAASILYHNFDDGKRLAVINCCEHEFSIAFDKHAGSNPLDPIKQYYNIQEARKKSDYVIVIVHGGHEHFQLPSPRMVETYRFFVDAGADAVINHHQHCFSGYEIWHNKPIFYGLGNLCFDNPQKRSGIWTEGFMVMLSFHLQNICFDIIPYRQCASIAKVELLPVTQFDESISSLNEIISNPHKLKNEVDYYYKTCEDKYSSIFEPVRNRIYLAAKHRGLLPSLISKKRRISAINYILCESHKDKLVHWLIGKD